MLQVNYTHNAKVYEFDLLFGVGKQKSLKFFAALLMYERIKNDKHSVELSNMNFPSYSICWGFSMSWPKRIVMKLADNAIFMFSSRRWFLFFCGGFFFWCVLFF
jgi:hypothetical protein